jgi:hypothetical protein
MPVIDANFLRFSEQPIKEQRSHIGYLESLLAMEAEERDRHAIQTPAMPAAPAERKLITAVDSQVREPSPIGRHCRFG